LAWNVRDHLEEQIAFLTSLPSCRPDASVARDWRDLALTKRRPFPAIPRKWNIPLLNFDDLYDRTAGGTAHHLT